MQYSASEAQEMSQNGQLAQGAYMTWNGGVIGTSDQALINKIMWLIYIRYIKPTVQIKFKR